MAGPLAGVTVVELAGIGPGPFAGMMLADMGARVLRVDRIPQPGGGPLAAMLRNDAIVDRGRESIAINTKDPRGLEVALDLAARADVLIEGFRPGVAEKLGLGPDAVMARNPRLVYGRMTGWGQSGPLAQAAGHDLNYIAISGALHAMGPADRPPAPPLNLVGDYGGGGMLLALGVVAALFESRTSGRGQVVDAAMSDGAALLMAAQYGLMAKGAWDGQQRETNFLDGSAPFYASYECADGRHIALGPIEPQFYAELLRLIGLDDDGAMRAGQWSQADWPAQKARLAAHLRTRTRDDWCALLEGTDACFAPVLSMREAPAHPHNVARGTFVQRAGATEPAPAPRFDRTPAELPPRAPAIGGHTAGLLGELGHAPADIDALVAAGVVFQAPGSGGAAC
ncbi:MAG: CoA transferase [Burkholderiales bacterium]|nr:CoA transferase [Burkholderiales bacterium]